MQTTKNAYRDVYMFYGYRDGQTNMHMKIYRQTKMELKTGQHEACNTQDISLLQKQLCTSTT